MCHSAGSANPSLNANVNLLLIIDTFGLFALILRSWRAVGRWCELARVLVFQPLINILRKKLQLSRQKDDFPLVAHFLSFYFD